MNVRNQAVLIVGLAWGLGAWAASPVKTMSGDPAASKEATRQIVITEQTTSVNVTHEEIVNFIVNGRHFAWRFDGPYETHFNLSDIAPEGILSHNVDVYIAREPGYGA